MKANKTMKRHTFIEPQTDLQSFPVVIEMWDNLKGGRHKRAFVAQFTPSERQQCGKLYSLFYRWHLVTGAPKEMRMTLNTYALARRLINFCGTV